MFGKGMAVCRVVVVAIVWWLLVGQALASVGYRQVVLDHPKAGHLKVDLWYPAGSNEGQVKKTFDLRDQLPEHKSRLLPPHVNTTQKCECYEDAPMETVIPPSGYPLIIHSHGVAAYSSVSLSQITHLAEKGYVVMAANHPGSNLRDVFDSKFASALRADAAVDAKLIIQWLRKSGENSPLLEIRKRIDLENIGLIGHSLGGGIGALVNEPGVKAFMALASPFVTDVKGEIHFMALVGGNDRMFSPQRLYDSFQEVPVAEKYFVELRKFGHISFTDMCSIGGGEGGLLELMYRYKLIRPLYKMVLGPFLGRIIDCEDSEVPHGLRVALINEITAMFMDHSLYGRSDIDLVGVQRRYGEWVVLR